MKNIKRWYGDLKLQSKFTITLILIVAIPAILTAVFFYGQVYDMVVSYTIKQAQDSSAKTAPLIDETLQNILDVSDRLTHMNFYKTIFHNPINESTTHLAQSKEAADFKKEIQEITDGNTITGIRIYADFPSTAGIFTEENTRDIFAPINSARGTYWYGIFQGSAVSELFCPSFYLGTQEQKLYGDMAYIKATTLYYRHKILKAYIAVYYSSTDFRDILSQNLAREGSVSYIVNERDNLVVSSDTSLSGIYWLSYETIKDSVMSSNNFIERSILDTTVYAAFYRIKEPDWFMVTVLPSKSLIKESNRLMRQLLLIYLTILVFAFFLANTLSRSITNRISSVINQMKTVRQGTLFPMDSPKEHDEIGDLIDTYNYMTLKMNQLIEKQAKAAEDLRIAEFNSLQAQINPHFLYNTMDMINWLAQQGRTSEIRNAVQSLSKFYKLTLSRKQSISTIAKEEEHVSIYVQLQNMRFHDNIELISDIPDELMEYQIPKLTLQPVIENAILHGILEKNTKSGTIVLTGWLEDKDIVLLISDDGVGISPEKLPTILSGTGQSSSGGTNIAIYNTHKRLQILYGSKYGLFYSSEPGKGTEVQIRIPAQKEYLNPYIQNSSELSDSSLPPLVTVANPEAMNMNSVSPETLLKYSQKITQNLYTLRNLHQISDKLSPAEDIYVLAHEVTGDFPEHNHDYFEINYLCRGSIINIIDGNEIYMTAGDLVFLNRNAVHYLRYLQKDTLFVNFCLKPEAFQHTLKTFYEENNLLSCLMRETLKKQNYIFFSLKHDFHAQALITSIIQEYANHRFHQSFALEGYFLLLFDYLATADEFSYLGTDVHTHEMIEFVQKNCLKANGQQLAAHFGLSESELDQKLKIQTGRNLKSLSDEMRLNYAVKLLETPEMNIYEIVEKCGFTDIDTFSSAFKRKLHISPEEYRKHFL